MNHKTSQAYPMKLTDLPSLHQPLPKSWIKAAGLLKGKKKLNPLVYQKKIRKEWECRFGELNR